MPFCDDGSERIEGYYCRDCVKKIQYRGDRIEILREIPNDDGDYECDICGSISSVLFDCFFYCDD